MCIYDFVYMRERERVMIQQQWDNDEGMSQQVF